MKKYFGTDGVRGIANAKNGLDPLFAFQLGQAVGQWMGAHVAPRAVLGRDTRQSGPMLESALTAGLNSAGVEVVSVGVAPTPAIAHIARVGDFGIGGIISASHNPAEDNGIKFVSHLGKKLEDADEAEIEGFLGADFERPTGGAVGFAHAEHELLEIYFNFLCSIVPKLEGLRIAVDAAHGAAFELGPRLLRELGATVFQTGCEPNGTNINAEGGATKPATIQEFTVAHGCDLGVAFDGDADRVIFSDSKGRLINGDRMMAIWAAHEKAQGRLSPPVVVGTLMSNGGFEHYLTSQGITLERVPVGDKYVSAKLVETGALVGGEQSGHIVFPAHGPTGDGLATMLEFIRVLLEPGRSASDWYEVYEPWPQVLYNLKVENPKSYSEHEAIKQAISLAEQSCRVNVRPSGTQPVLRVMVEAPTEATRDNAAKAIVEAILQAMGGHVESRVDLTHSLGD